MACARDAESIGLLWEVCQIPDYRQLQLDDHFQLLRAVFLQLRGPRQRLADDWIRRHVDHLDNAHGDIDTLLARMAFIRTWTYITHHTRWVADARAWQERARAIEDRLSDALHEQLVARFVDPTSRRTRSRDRREGSLGEQLRAVVPVRADAREEDTDQGAAIGRWIEGLVDAAHERFRLDEAGRILDGDRELARLAAGVDRLRPEVTLLLDDLGAGRRLRLQAATSGLDPRLGGATATRALPQFHELRPALAGGSRLGGLPGSRVMGARAVRVAGGPGQFSNAGGGIVRAGPARGRRVHVAARAWRSRSSALTNICGGSAATGARTRFANRSRRNSCNVTPTLPPTSGSGSKKWFPMPTPSCRTR